MSFLALVFDMMFGAVMSVRNLLALLTLVSSTLTVVRVPKHTVSVAFLTHGHETRWLLLVVVIVLMTHLAGALALFLVLLVLHI